MDENIETCVISWSLFHEQLPMRMKLIFVMAISTEYSIMAYQDVLSLTIAVVFSAILLSYITQASASGNSSSSSSNGKQALLLTSEIEAWNEAIHGLKRT